jgi:hypothetical protein
VQLILLKNSDPNLWSLAEKIKKDECQKNTLRINFERDFGWNFVRVPLEFNADYCAGSCFGMQTGKKLVYFQFPFICANLKS